MVSNKYIVRFSGPDIPGLLNSVSICLRLHGFSIIDVSMSSGAKTSSTFITCLRTEEGGNGLINTGRQGVDHLVLDSLVTGVLSRMYGKAKPYFDVKVSPDGQVPSELVVYVDVTYTVNIAIIPVLTSLLRPCFSIDSASTRADFERRNDDSSALDLYLRLSPRCELESPQAVSGLSKDRSLVHQALVALGFLDDKYVQVLHKELINIWNLIIILSKDTCSSGHRSSLQLMAKLVEMIMQLRYQFGYDLYVRRVAVEHRGDDVEIEIGSEDEWFGRSASYTPWASCEGGKVRLTADEAPVLRRYGSQAQKEFDELC